MRGTSKALDVVLSLAGLSLGAPLVVFAAIGIRLTSPGPVFFLTERVGKDGHPFVMFKLRTMHADATGAPVTGAGDSRIVPFGHFLRKTKIDELPQLFNILRGDMSIVGPRPEAPSIVAESYAEAEWRTLRVRPGLTSPGTLWYFNQAEDSIDAEETMDAYLPVMREKLRRDAEYAQTANLKTDLQVIGLTFVAIARKLSRHLFSRLGADREVH